MESSHLPRTREKADVLFAMYYQMGHERTLKKIADLCRQIGVRASEKTLLYYSKNFHWQERILELDNQAEEQRKRDNINQVNEMNNIHAQYSRAYLGLFTAGMQNFNRQTQAQRDRGERPYLDISVQDLGRILETAQKTERLARGEATSRTEILVETISFFVREFAQIFLMVNSIPDEDERRITYIQRCDDMIKAIEPSAEMGSLKLFRSS